MTALKDTFKLSDTVCETSNKWWCPTKTESRVSLTPLISTSVRQSNSSLVSWLGMRRKRGLDWSQCDQRLQYKFLQAALKHYKPVWSCCTGQSSAFTLLLAGDQMILEPPKSFYTHSVRLSTEVSVSQFVYSMNTHKNRTLHTVCKLQTPTWWVKIKLLSELCSLILNPGHTL